MKYGYTIFYVSNVEETIEFYEKAFALKRKFVHESGQYGELDTGATTLAFVGFDLAESNQVGFARDKKSKTPSDMELAFISDDVEAAFHHAVSVGAVIVKDPAQKPWGQTVAYVRDNNGFLVEICSPL